MMIPTKILYDLVRAIRQDPQKAVTALAHELEQDKPVDEDTLLYDDALHFFHEMAEQLEAYRLDAIARGSRPLPSLGARHE
jgi:hypothetical protein